ncbi:MAG: histidine phosphatase family protein [Bacteroidales bacterium]|nr:histidine phosphatase family protein [Bacteroidales bacterium]
MQAKRSVIYALMLLQITLLLVSCAGKRKLTNDVYLNGFDDSLAFTHIEAAADSGQMKIYLVRHAKPDVKKKKVCTSVMAQAYVDAYAKAPIIPFDSSLVSYDLPYDQTIYCSSLRRAHETAQAIFGNEFNLLVDSQFREFETRIIAQQNTFSLPLIVWQSLSRAAWVIGLNNSNIESYKEAKARAQQVAVRLALQAEEQQTVVLVAHGMLNRAVAAQLKKNGWQIRQQQGHINIGATVLVKE